MSRTAYRTLQTSTVRTDSTRTHHAGRLRSHLHFISGERNPRRIHGGIASESLRVCRRRRSVRPGAAQTHMSACAMSNFRTRARRALCSLASHNGLLSSIGVTWGLRRAWQQSSLLSKFRSGSRDLVPYQHRGHVTSSPTSTEVT